MPPTLRKTKAIALVAALFYCVYALIEGYLKSKFGYLPKPIDSESLALLKTILIVVSVYGFIVALAFQYWRTSLLNRLGTRQGRFSPESRFLLINYLLLVSPVLYGRVLYFSGIQLREYIYFIVASIIMTIAWALYDFRKI